MPNTSGKLEASWARAPAAPTTGQPSNYTARAIDHRSLIAEKDYPESQIADYN